MRQNQQLKDKQKELQKLTPADFHRKIQDFLRNLVDKLEGTGVEINLEPVSIEAMVLSAPKIEVNQAQRGRPVKADDNGNWMGPNNQVQLSARFRCDKWICVYHERDQRDVQGRLLQGLRNNGGLNGSMNYRDPEWVPVSRARGRDFIKAFDEKMQQLKGDHHLNYRDIQFVFVVLPREINDDSPDYNYIKKQLYVNGKLPGEVNSGYVPLASQMMKISTLNHKAFRSVCHNLSIQIMNKQGIGMCAQYVCRYLFVMRYLANVIRLHTCFAHRNPSSQQ
jgi:hypothetical protein